MTKLTSLFAIASAATAMLATSSCKNFLQVENPNTVTASDVDPLADAEEMITFFNISGAMVYLDEKGNQSGYEDVFTKIKMCRKHYQECGLGADYVDQFIR